MAAAPTVASQMVALNELFNTAGANDSIRHYLAAKKISTTPTLALIAKNAEDFTTMIVAPFLAGVTIDGQEHKAEAGDEPVATAIMIHLFVEARRQWDIFSQAPTAPPPTTVAPAAAQTAAGNTPTSPAVAAHIPDRPPKTFAAWTQQVTAYEEKLFDGKRRTFPVQELLGAEEVLARMWFEHTVTKMYTPVTLGEILCRRTWTPGRMLNRLAADRAAKSAGSKALRLEHGALVPEEPSEWSPRGLLSTIDGANAARWAWILVGVGEEADVIKYADWFIAKPSTHADMVPAIQAYWHKSAWTIAMALRNSTSFGEAVKSVMNDVATWQEIIIANAAPAARRPQRQHRGVRRPGSRHMGGRQPSQTPSPGQAQGQRPRRKGPGSPQEDGRRQPAGPGLVVDERRREAAEPAGMVGPRRRRPEAPEHRRWGQTVEAHRRRQGRRPPLGTARGLGFEHRSRRGTRPVAEENSTLSPGSPWRRGHCAVGI